MPPKSYIEMTVKALRKSLFKDQVLEWSCGAGHHYEPGDTRIPRPYARHEHTAETVSQYENPFCVYGIGF